MKRFREYIDKALDIDRIKDTGKLQEWGISIRYFPDPVEDFDEFEFGLDYEGKEDVAFVVTIEKGEIKRMLFGMPDKDNPEILRPMNDGQLSALLDKKGDALVSFFRYVTK